MKEPTQIDWARLAAYIDGEGCIKIAACHSVRWKREYLYVDLRVTGTDARLANWLAQTFGGKVYWGKRQNVRWKPSFHWVVACRKAHDILFSCLPYFIMKRDQAEIALSFQATRKRWGVKGAPKEVLEHQYQLRESLTSLTRRGLDETIQ